MSDPLRFLLSGPGLMGKQHAQLINSRSDCRLSAIIAPPADENRTFALEIGAGFYLNIEDALEKERIDAAIISSPNPFHFHQAISCIERNVPVLVEKPITDNIDDARKLADRSEDARVPVLVGHHRTYSPLLDAAVAFLNSARFGRLVAVQGSALFYKPVKYFKDGAWRTKVGGGPILINLIHEIGLLRYFCGEIKTVFALAGRQIRNFEVEDTVAVTFEFWNGALGSFLLSDTAASSKSWEMTSGENPVYPHFPEENCYHFAGTNGSLDFPSMWTRYYADGVEPSWWNDFETGTIAFTPRNPLELQLDHFVQVVRGKAQPTVSARDGYRNMLVIQAIALSINSRAVVDLERLTDRVTTQ
jgi:predicted dehydrogenase